MKSLVLGFLLLLIAFPVYADDKNESVYDRVINAGTIRCGYYVWPPFIARDPNSGEISGIAPDMVNRIGELLSLKIEWTAELNFDAMFEGYATGRYDMICAPLVITPARARASDFTDKFAYVTYELYAKEGDTRFDNAYEKANAPDIRYATLDGDMNEVLREEIFPRTQSVGIGNVASNVDPLMMIATGKADVTTLEPVAAKGFMKANPGKIRKVAGPPVRVMPLAYSVPQGEEKFKALINIALQNLVETGYVDRILANYPDYDATVLRIAPGYVMPPQKE